MFIPRFFIINLFCVGILFSSVNLTNDELTYLKSKKTIAIVFKYAFLYLNHCKIQYFHLFVTFSQCIKLEIAKSILYKIYKLKRIGGNKYILMSLI